MDPLLSQLGEQAVVILTPGPENGPPALALVTELRATETLPTQVKTIAGMACMVAQMEAQKKKIEAKVALQREQHAGVELTTMLIRDPNLKGHVNPTMAVKDGYMVLATSPECAKAVLSAADAAGRGRGGQKRSLLFDITMNMTRVKELVKRHNAFLVQQGINDGKTEDQARRDMVALEWVLGFFKDVHVQADYVPGRIDRILTVRFDDMKETGPDLPAEAP
jgi:hypothetical protein